jgi:hypothetical protein
MKINPILLSLSLLACICIYSCKHEEDVSRWDANMLAPLMHSSISLNNLVADSLISKATDHSLSIVYKNTLYKASIDTLFKIPDTSATSNAKLETLVLPDNTINYGISLGSIAKQSGFPGFVIISNNGKKMAIPKISPISSADIPIDAGSYFETMTLKTGNIVVKIKNELPVDLTNVIFKISNQSDGSVVVLDTFAVIKAGGADSINTSLAGKTIQRNLIIKLVSLSSPGSNGNSVLIDTSNAIRSSIAVKNLKPSSATARFPDQNLINNTTKLIALDLPSVQLKSVKLRHGDVVMIAYSTLQDSLYLTYTIPSATKAGTPFKKDFVIPPAPKGGNSHFDLLFDFTGYTLDLTSGKGFNTLATTVLARIQYTGKLKTLSLSDSIYFHVGFKNLLPDYAKGYLGQKTINLNSSAPLNMFSKIASGTLNLQNVNFLLHFENGIGVEESFQINNITAINSRTKTQTVLTGTIVGPPPIVLPRATEAPAAPLRVIPSVMESALTPANSNIKAIIESLPDKLQYQMSANLNPNGNTSNGNDFVYFGTGINASLNMEIPLNLIANKLELKDTVDFTFGNIDAVKNKKILGGQLTLLSDNGFPFDANIQVYLLADNYSKIDSLISYGKIDAAPVDAANKVSAKKRSKLVIPLSQAKLDKLQAARKLFIVANFSSIPAATPLKIYSDYTIDFKLVGDFKYGIK